MKVDIKVPSVGESVVEATISQILQPSGSLVQQDQEIIELETEKVNQVLYASKAGKITLSVKVGDVVKVGQTIGEIDTDVTVPTIAAPSPAAPPKPVEAAPSIRKMAPEYIAELKEPSPPKAVVKEVAPSSSDKMVRKKMTSLRRTIAARLVEAKNSTAMLTTFNEVDMSTILDLRAKEQEAFVKKYGVKLGFMSFFIRACVSALKAYPAVNSMIDGEDLVTFYTYDIGVAVSTERGLLVPVVRNADQLSFGEIEQTLAELAKKAREGKISMDELRGGSFTISNGGIFGSLVSTPILNPPQSGVLGMHAITKRPIAIEDKVVIRPMMYLALSYDHRVIDGKEAIQFLGHLKESLQDPAKLLLYDSQI